VDLIRLSIVSKQINILLRLPPHPNSNIPASPFYTGTSSTPSITMYSQAPPVFLGELPSVPWGHKAGEYWTRGICCCSGVLVSGGSPAAPYCAQQTPRPSTAGAKLTIPRYLPSLPPLLLDLLRRHVDVKVLQKPTSPKYNKGKTRSLVGNTCA